MGYGIPAQLVSSPSSTGYSMVTGYPAILAAVSCDGTPGGTVSVYDGKLFVGIGNTASYNAILIYNGHTWTTSFVGNYEHEVFRLVPALGGLYAGMGYKHGWANIYKYKG